MKLFYRPLVAYIEQATRHRFLQMLRRQMVSSNQSEEIIAARLKTSEAKINKRLAQPLNWSIDEMARYCAGLGFKLHFSLEPFSEKEIEQLERGSEGDGVALNSMAHPRLDDEKFFCALMELRNAAGDLAFAYRNKTIDGTQQLRLNKALAAYNIMIKEDDDEQES